jgi:hypothetical protein
VHELLTRQDVHVPYSSLHRFAIKHCGFAERRRITVRMAECEPGELAEVEFGRLGYVPDPQSGRKRLLWALVVVLPSSRHQYVHVTHSQKISDLIGGLEDAWEFFGGTSRRVILDNLRAAVQTAMPQLPESANRLLPAKALLDLLTLALAHGVSRMPRGPSIDSAAAPARVLRDMRRHAQGPASLDEGPDVACPPPPCTASGAAGEHLEKKRPQQLLRRHRGSSHTRIHPREITREIVKHLVAQGTDLPKRMIQRHALFQGTVAEQNWLIRAGSTNASSRGGRLLQFTSSSPESLENNGLFQHPVRRP